MWISQEEKKNKKTLINHHEGEVQGEPEEEEERPLLLLESLPEVPRDLASLRETEQASAGSFFIGVKGGVVIGLDGPDGVGCATSSSPELEEEEPPISNLDGDVSGVSNGVFAPLALFIASLS